MARKKAKRTPERPARRRPAKRLSAAPATRRRRRRRTGTLSSGNANAILMQTAMAIAGGVLGKVARNAIPSTMSPEIRAGAVAAGGVMVAYFTKQPMIGAGMIGSAGAFLAASYGEKFNIPLLSSSNQGDFVMLQEGPADYELYFDHARNPMKKVGEKFYYQNGNLAPYSISDFKKID